MNVQKNGGSNVPLKVNGTELPHANKILVKNALFYGKISSVVVFILTIIIVFLSYYISQKKKEATYYGTEDKLDQEFFANNPKYIKQREEMEICHIQNDINPNNSNNVLEGSIKILQKKMPTSVVIHSNTNIIGGNESPEKDGRIILPSTSSVQAKIEAIIEYDRTKKGREILETVQRRISDKIYKMGRREKQKCYNSKVCGMIAMETRHALENLSDELWVVYGNKADNTFVTSGLHNIFENTYTMVLFLTLQVIVPDKCKILAFKVERNKNTIPQEQCDVLFEEITQPDDDYITCGSTQASDSLKHDNVTKNMEP
uniref:TNF_2 domain-containing protein n=1 Tax=Parastrongyloides trichosuri TaxID=131310 RepID=A0A0N5A2F9_PARTI